MKKYEITKEQIETLVDVSKNAEIRLKEWFPEAFKTVLEVGKWYKYNAHGLSFFYVTKIEGKKVFAYGFNYKGVWRYDCEWFEIDNYIPEILEIASESEVFEALKNEAVRRGFKEGVWYRLPSSETVSRCGKSMMLNNRNYQILYFGDYCIFKDGQWAEIIETVCKNASESLLRLQENIDSLPKRKSLFERFYDYMSNLINGGKSIAPNELKSF